MSSKTAKIMTALKRSAPIAYRSHKSDLYAKRYSFVLYGIAVEFTAYKDTFSLRRLVFPMFFDTGLFYMNYSPHVFNTSPDAPGHSWFKGDPPLVAKQMLDVIQQKNLLPDPPLHGIAPFLAHCSPADIGQAPIQTVLDHSAATAISGDLASAARHLDTLRIELEARLGDPDVHSQVPEALRHIEAALAAIHQGHRATLAHFRQTSATIAEKFGILPSA